MKKLALFALVMTLVSCGEDVGSNRAGRSPAPGTPTQTTAGATAESLGSKPMSGMFRTRATIQLTTAEEISRISTSGLPSSYRAIPNMITDDEGSDKNSVTRTSMGRPTVECGTSTSLSGINARMADCLLKNPEKSSWIGLNNGSSSEGDWRLVSLAANGKETWLDERTGLVWSDMIASANWCKASGNNDQMTVDCAVVGENLNFCEAQTTEMNLNIRWRLPTRNDFLQADLDGARLVLKPGSFWTATLDSKSTTRAKAWIYTQDQGILSSDSLTTLHEVRCVGAPIRQ
jgi:hypothetical protein